MNQGHRSCKRGRLEFAVRIYHLAGVSDEIHTRRPYSVRGHDMGRKFESRYLYFLGRRRCG